MYLAAPGDDWLRASNRFSLERVLSEIDYIAKKFSASKKKFNGYLYLADSNFGIEETQKSLQKLEKCANKPQLAKVNLGNRQRIQMRR